MKLTYVCETCGKAFAVEHDGQSIKRIFNCPACEMATHGISAKIIADRIVGAGGQITMPILDDELDHEVVFSSRRLLRNAIAEAIEKGVRHGSR